MVRLAGFVIQLAVIVLQYMHERGELDAAARQILGAYYARLTALLDNDKKIRDGINALSDDELDSVLDRLAKRGQ